jgi:hypothetical protein
VLLTFYVFCVVIFGWLSVAHFFVFCVVIFGWLSVARLFGFLCCDFWLAKITTQKTKNVSNTQPTKNHNTENKKGEQYLTNQKSQHRKPKRRATLNLFCVVIFGWLSVAHLFCFLCCDFWLVECCSPF